MHELVRKQMTRYPVFSCQSDSYIDDAQMFKDEELKNVKIKQSHHNLIMRGNSVKIRLQQMSMKIMTNKFNDSIFIHSKKQKEKTKNKSTATSTRNSRNELQRGERNNSQSKTISKLVGQLSQDLDKKEPEAAYVSRNKKVSLLKRIIEHYNIKSIEKKYNSNLTPNIGLRIQSVNSNQITTKKNLYAREIRVKQITTRQKTQEYQSGNSLTLPLMSKTIDPDQFNEKNNKTTKKTQSKILLKSSMKCIKQQYSFNNSREDITQSCKAKNNSFIETNINLKGQISQKLGKNIQHSQKLIQKPIKLNIPTTIHEKINKYKEFLFVINYTNRLYRNLDIEKYQQPFKFYIGKGNNGNLIKSLMKKRFWFQQTEDPKGANFIWTQIKLQLIFQKQQLSCRKQIADNLQDFLVLNQNQCQFEQQKAVQISPIKNQLIFNDKVDIKKLKFAKLKCKAKDYAPKDPFQKIATLQDIKTLKDISKSIRLKKNSNFGDKARYSKIKLNQQDNVTFVHNHLPFNGFLGNKKALYYNLKEYCHLTQKKLSQFIPLTFHIKKGLTDLQYKLMSAAFTERKKQKKPNYWIMKPGEFSNRGQGITCTNKLQQIRKRISKCQQQSKSGKQSTLIVQLYISNPLLYNGRKFDIRTYMMITINNNKIKGYWYQEGYIRTSSFAWTLLEIQDKYIHLTNDAIQKTCDEYGKYQPGNKLTYGDLQRYIYSTQKGEKPVQFFQAIYPQMRNIATDAIKSTCLNLDPKKLRDNFQVFGLDFMIDDNYKPWLIQVNTNPCLELSCPILERIIPHMVQNALRIAIDPLFPPPSTINSEYKYSIPENALNYNKFQLVFDEDRDGQTLKKLYKNSKIMEQLVNLQQEKQTYQEDGQILQLNQV